MFHGRGNKLSLTINAIPTTSICVQESHHVLAYLGLVVIDELSPRGNCSIPPFAANSLRHSHSAETKPPSAS
jgi:hypothetical protein